MSATAMRPRRVGEILDAAIKIYLRHARTRAIRNLMRVIDGPLLLYLPSLIGVAVTAHNQRPGDMAAGTVVIREPAGAPRRRRGAPGVSSAAPAPPPATQPAARWDASAVTGGETAAVRHFLARRDTLDAGARHALAQRLASGLRPKVAGAPKGLESEAFLEQLAEIKRGR